MAQDVRTMSAVDETKQLAWVVLLAANRTQAKDSTIRLVVPRAPEVADEMGMEPTEDRMVAVEEYLLERGYVASVDIGLTRGTYTITPAGFSWLDEDLQEPPEAPEMAAAEAERATPEDYSPEEEVRKLHTKQKKEARGRREQAERRITEQEEALERREDAERWMRGRRSP